MGSDGISKLLIIGQFICKLYDGFRFGTWKLCNLCHNLPPVCVDPKMASSEYRSRLRQTRPPRGQRGLSGHHYRKRPAISASNDSIRSIRVLALSAALTISPVLNSLYAGARTP